MCGIAGETGAARRGPAALCKICGKGGIGVAAVVPRPATRESLVRRRSARDRAAATDA